MRQLLALVAALLVLAGSAEARDKIKVGVIPLKQIVDASFLAAAIRAVGE